MLDAHGLSAMQQLIVLELARQECRRRGLRVTQAEIDAEFRDSLNRIAPQQGADGVTLSWTDLEGSSGAGTTYDVAGGSLGVLRAARVAEGECLADGLGVPSHVDTRSVAGDGSWYLVRGVNSCGPEGPVGWGAGSTGSPRTACP